METETMTAVRSDQAEEAEPDELVESDLLIEDISIDGTCGVY